MGSPRGQPRGESQSSGMSELCRKGKARDMKLVTAMGGDERSGVCDSEWLVYLSGMSPPAAKDPAEYGDL